jgi:hypothetical protein
MARKHQQFWNEKGQLIELRSDGTTVVIDPGNVVEGVSYSRRTRTHFQRGRARVIDPLPGRLTREAQESAAKFDGRYRSEAFKIRPAPADGRERKCRWCSCTLTPGEPALERWMERPMRYRWVCLACGAQRGYKALRLDDNVSRRRRLKRQRKPATEEQLKLLAAHFNEGRT